MNNLINSANLCILHGGKSLNHFFDKSYRVETKLLHLVASFFSQGKKIGTIIDLKCITCYTRSLVPLYGVHQGVENFLDGTVNLITSANSDATSWS